MKKLILNIMLAAVLLTALSAIAVNANLAVFFGNRIIFLDDDPNEPQPEAVLNCSDEDPNEPQPESMLTNCSDEDPNEPQPEAVLNCSDEDPNDPQPEIILASCSDDDPNEPQPESI